MLWLQTVSAQAYIFYSTQTCMRVTPSLLLISVWCVYNCGVVCVYIIVTELTGQRCFGGWGSGRTVGWGLTGTPTMMKLLTGKLSARRGLGALGGGWVLDSLGQGGASVQLPHWGGPGQVFNHFNLYCRQRGASEGEDEMKKSR